MTETPTEYVLVPREPSEEMVQAGAKAVDARTLGDTIQGDCRTAYRAMLSASPKPQGDERAFQERVRSWVVACFPALAHNDLLERQDRFIEEALELVQALGYSRDRAFALVDYVFDREAGSPPQEVGGVMMTLAALCSAARLDMAECGETELSRVCQPEIMGKIRAKQAAKPVGSALPVAASPTINRGADSGRLEPVKPFNDGGLGMVLIHAFEAYHRDYVLSTEGDDYTPTQFERDLIEDFFHGLLAEPDFWNPIRDAVYREDYVTWRALSSLLVSEGELEASRCSPDLVCGDAKGAASEQVKP